MELTMRQKEKDIIEAGAPDYITPAVLKEQEMLKKRAGPSVFLLTRKEQDTIALEETRRLSQKASSRMSAKPLASQDSTVSKHLIRLKIKWKNEFLQSEINFFEKEFEMEKASLVLKRNQLKAWELEKVEEQQDVNNEESCFRCHVEDRGRLTEKEAAKASVSASFNAFALTKFHRKMVKNYEKTLSLLGLSTSSLNHHLKKFEQLAERKKENMDCVKE